MEQRILKKGEIIVELNNTEYVKEKEFNVAFFEKRLKTKNNEEMVREYISINTPSDKYSKLIRPSMEQRFANVMGDSYFLHDKKRYVKAYKVFTELKKSLNTK